MTQQTPGLDPAHHAQPWHALARGTSLDVYAWVAGEARALDGPAGWHRVHPGDGRGLGPTPAGSAADATAALDSARRAFDDGRWHHQSPGERKAVLQRWATLVERDHPQLALADCLEVGKPIAMACGEAMAAAAFIRFYAEALDKMQSPVLASDRGSLSFGLHEPLGVVAAIVPWNFPLLNLVVKAAPALAAGNTLVAKPSEVSPSSALLLARLASEAGLPAGVFNVVPGLGQSIGDALATSAAVDLLSFTGSTRTGLRLMERVGQSRMKRLMLECGGKSPEIVFDDLDDIEGVAASLCEHAFFNQGQLCVASSRLLVSRALRAPLVNALRARLERVAPSVRPDLLDPNTAFQPLASPLHCERVLRAMHAAESDGAQMLHQGGRLWDADCWVQPALFEDREGVQSTALRQEIFGPVLNLQCFDTEAQAVALANDSDYGLCAKVWTRDAGQSQRMARALRAGDVRVYATTAAREGAGFATASEPVRQSGFGVEGGIAALRSYSALKAVEFSFDAVAAA